jgi:periplasmic protein TonB
MKPGRPLRRSGAEMKAPLSSLLGAYAGGLAFAGSVGVHGALLLVALRAGTAPAAHAVPSLVEREVDVDLVAVAPAPDPPPPPLAPLAPHPAVATEPSVRVTQLRPAPAPVAPVTSVTPDAPPPRATSTTDPPAPPVVQEAAAALTADEGMPHFTIAVGGGSGQVFGAAASTGSARVEVVEAPAPQQGVSSPARCAGGGTPPYPPGARRDGVEGDVLMALVLSTSGTVESVRVLKGPGHGLDEAAVAAVRTWRCSPKMEDGRSIRVTMPWTMQFRLR